MARRRPDCSCRATLRERNGGSTERVAVPHEQYIELKTIWLQVG